MGWSACRILDRLLDDETGATMVEYSLLIGLISLISLALIVSVGNLIKTLWTNTNAVLQANPVAS
jgi:Flp pilus assembly pilin Flp